jgi:hypothetical protein
VFTHGSTPAASLDTHGATAAVVAVTAGQLLREAHPQVRRSAAKMDGIAATLAKE